LTGIGIAALVWVGISLVQYSAAPENPETVRVAAIQMGQTEVAFSHPDMDAQARFNLLADLTRDAAAQNAEIISWSELALPFDPQLEYTAELRALATETNAYLVLPYGVFEEEGLRNEVVILSPDGEFSEPYAKAHPVLFAGEPYGLNVGTYPVYDTPIGTIASIICYDLNYTDVTRKMAAQGAQIIVAPSSDWEGISEKQNIHLVFRAIETRTGIVNAEKAFDSAIVDPYGHILEQTTYLEPTQALLIADLPLGTADSLYLILGDWLGWIALAGMAFFAFFSDRLVKWEQKKVAGS
jgi:apolipoprotein N-acyltransferase